MTAGAQHPLGRATRNHVVLVECHVGEADARGVGEDQGEEDGA